MSNLYYYTWRGHPVEVEKFDGGDSGIDVSYHGPPEHPDGTVPPGETHYLVHLCVGNGRWWVTEDDFHKNASPLGLKAIRDADDTQAEQNNNAPVWSPIHYRAHIPQETQERVLDVSDVSKVRVEYDTSHISISAPLYELPDDQR